jgi:formylglycine-generating enzyme required for sulfatase activity
VGERRAREQQLRELILDPDLVLNAFLRRYLADSEAGSKRSCDSYQRLFPGHEQLVATEYAKLGAAASDRSEVPFGRYRLLRELGRGGQGVVHLALDTKLDRQVALKVLTGVSAFSGEVLKRFKREAEVASRIDHAGVCSVFDAGEIDRTPYIAMRYVDGETLAQRIASARTPPGPAALPGIIEIVEKAARALHAAHQAGVLHRDVKPGNLMVTSQGDPVILDFGLARALEGESDGLTRTGDSFGTPSYMAPEQVSGGKLDARTDVYGLGATLYEALTLHRPFEEPTRDKLYHAICTQRPVPPSRHNPAVKGDLEVVMGCALEADRGRRYESALAFAEDLRRVREFEPIQARPTGPLVHLARWARRNPALAGATAALFVLLLGGLALTLWLLQDARAERDSKNTALGLVERLSDVKRLEDLRADAGNLWPAEPAIVPAMQAWLGRADAIARALPGHRAALDQLRANGRKDASVVEGWAFDSTEQQWHHDTLARLVRDLETFLTAPPPAGVVSDVRARMAFAESVRRLTLEEPRREWEETIAAIAASPRYGGLRIAPQLGLVPLGPDPQSGLFEFAHLQTGAVPKRGADGKLVIDASSAIVLVLVPAGRFRMGSPVAGAPETQPSDVVDPDARYDEIPVHDVTLDAFFISKYEMTQAQWIRVTGSNPGGGEDIQCPLRHATYEECERVMRNVGLTMPTEAQWECAARGGTGTRWWTGADIRSVEGAGNVADQSVGIGGPSSWHLEAWKDGYGNVAPVGRFRPNPFGLHDTIGNVWEFVRDHHGPYSNPPRPGDGLRVRPDESSSDQRICRSGSYIYGAIDARTTRRSLTTVTGRSVYNGIRPGRELRTG